MSHIFEQGLDKNSANFTALSPVSFVERSAEIFGDLPAVIHGQRKYTWAQTRERSARLAAALKSLGITRGSTVSAMLPNTPEMVEVHYAVPALNAWFDGKNLTRTLHPHVDIGIAVDTEDGLFVPALRNADMLDARGIREGVNRLREQVESRSIAASELSGYTISLSNFGMFAGRYATPVVVPPCVAIVGAGRARHQMTPVMGGVEAHKVIPLSVTFDHRAATGGEAARFLRAMMDDLALAS